MRLFPPCSNAAAAPSSLLTWIFFGVDSVMHAAVWYVLMLESMRQQLSRTGCYVIANLTLTPNVWHRFFGFRREDWLCGICIAEVQMPTFGWSH